MKKPGPDSSPQSEREVSRSASRGIAALGYRQIVVLGANLLGSIALARIFSPSDLGLLVVFLLLLSLSTVMGDLGFSGALVRRVEPPSAEELKLAFTVQSGLGVSIFVILILASPTICSIYKIDPNIALDFRIVAVCALLLPLSSIAQMRLERQLNFGAVARIEILQTILYNGSAVIMGAAGLGIHALAVAVLLRTTAGCLLLNIAMPWRPGLAWNRRAISEHLRYGLPYQASRWLSFFKDMVNPLLVGLTLSLYSVGQLSWAQTVAAYPVLALAVLRRLYLPAFAKLQNDETALRRLVERTIWLTACIVAPLSTTLLALIDPITKLVYGGKWLSAVPYFYLFWAGNIFASIAAPLMSLLEATGRTRRALAMSALWLIATWTLTPLLILLAGTAGLALANLAVQLTNFQLFSYCRRHWSVDIVSSVAVPWFSASISGLLLFSVNQVLPASNTAHLIIYLGGSLILNLLFAGLLDRKRWLSLIDDLRKER